MENSIPLKIRFLYPLGNYFINSTLKTLDCAEYATALL